MENNNLKPLAVVNSKAIYESDIDEMIAQMGQRGAAYQSEQGRAMILEQLIAQRLFLADAMRNLYERVWGKAAYRQSLHGNEPLVILASDLAGATEDREFKHLMTDRVSNRRVIGFGIK